ncbi:MAG: hypothetical protein KDD94_04060, partial [Calditrichaeota bacterium]|nr:hypothetical protein [Calditrichota bacterium]
MAVSKFAMRCVFSAILLIISSCSKSSDSFLWLASSPATKQYTEINKQGKTVLPNGRIITPLGRSIITAPHPFGLTLSPDGQTVVTANSGTSPLSITIIHHILSENPQVQQIPPGPSTDEGVLASVFMGLAISPDNKTVYVAGGQENKIYLFDLKTGAANGSIDCSQGDYLHGYIGDMTLSSDGKTLYAVDQIGFRMVIVNTEKRSIVSSVPVGRYPFGICLSPDEKKVYVANVGMFQYAFIRKSNDPEAKIKPIDYPPFAYATEEMKSGVKTDTSYAQGLGDLNAIEAFSVFVVDISQNGKEKVVSKIKTGHLVGSLVEDIPAVGGSSPNSLVATDKYVFVSNGTNDNISVISTEKDTIVQTIYLKLDSRIRQFRGVIPFGMALSPDKKRLYVAESGINAIAVIDIPSLSVLGHLATGWFPSKLKVSQDGKQLIIANAKGYGSGPNGGVTFQPDSAGSYIGSLMRGTVQILDIPPDDQLVFFTQQVIANNFKFNKSTDAIYTDRKQNPVPLYPGEKTSPIKHIVFISKENRTYDEIYGQHKKGRGDSTIARYGYNVTFSNKDKSRTIKNVTVAPNHLQLAKEFAISDNFYVDADVSADGHRWLVNMYPNEWVETATAASYGDNRKFREDSKAPGVFGMNSSAGAIYPEDYNEAGSMWDHLDRHQVDFYNFGFSIMFEPALYKKEYKYTGIHHYVNFPLPKPLYDKTSRMFPTYNMAIPDQFRVDQFKKEFTDKWLNTTDTMPAFITVILPNDHGAGERPEAGYPFRESYMGD